jgi:predicted DNA-binding transcriptional regulator AlpA
MIMSTFSTRAAATKLGLPHPTLAHYIRVGKIPRPKSFTSGGMTVHVWSEKDIERVRKLLSKLEDGRKTRYQKQKAKRKSKPRQA